MPVTYLRKKSFFECHGINADIVMIGDSITEGAEWHELFEKHSIVNRGISGDTAEGILNRIDSIISTKAKKFFIMVGINDFKGGASVSMVYSNYKEIIKILNEKNMIPYIQSTVYAGERRSNLNVNISSLNKKLKKLSEKKGFVYIDLNSKLSSNYLLNKKYSEDDVHLNGEGYSVWKNIISKYIN